MAENKGGKIWPGDRFQGGKASKGETDRSGETAGNQDKVL